MAGSPVVSRRSALRALAGAGAINALRPQISLAAPDGRQLSIRAIGRSASGDGLLALVDESGSTTLRRVPIEGGKRIGALGPIVQSFDSADYVPVDLSTAERRVSATVGSSIEVTAVDHGESVEGPSQEELEEPSGPFSIDTGSQDTRVRPGHSEGTAPVAFDRGGVGIARDTTSGRTATVVVHSTFGDGDHYDHASVITGGGAQLLRNAGVVVGAAVSVEPSGMVIVALDVLDEGVDVWSIGRFGRRPQRVASLDGALPGTTGIGPGGRIFSLTTDGGGAMTGQVLTGRRWRTVAKVDRSRSSLFRSDTDLQHVLPIRGVDDPHWLASSGDLFGAGEGWS